MTTPQPIPRRPFNVVPALHLPTTSPEEIGYYADHDSATLRSIADRYTEQSLQIALGSGADHPLVVAALAIATAATGALLLRGEPVTP